MDTKRARNFCFTLNNYTEDELEEVKLWECRYLIFGKEVGESGTPHLQGYVYFDNAKTLEVLKKKFQARAHWEIAIGTPNRNAAYCAKGEQTKAEWEAEKEKGPNYGKNADVFEKGERPLSDKEKGALGKRAFEEAFEAYKEKRYEDMGQFALNMKAFDYLAAKIEKRDQPAAVTLDGDLEHEWFYGPSGAGKSYAARQQNPGAYIKDPKNAWWDGYKGEDVVIIDDFDKFQVKQSGDMKRWLDRYPFKAECKGGYIGDIRPKKIVVTANYHPNEIWEQSDITLSTILRRVKVTRFDTFPPAAPGSGDGGAPARGLRLVAPNIQTRSPDSIASSRGSAEGALGDPPSPNRFTSHPFRFLHN